MATMVSDPTTEMLDTAKALAPRLRAAAAQMDAERRLPAALAEEMRRAGFFGLLLPREYSGLQIDPVGVSRIVEEVSRADGSAGWCVMIANQSCAFAGLLPPDSAKEVWADKGVLAAVGRPIGRAEVDTERGGYVVSGRWPFASGSSHATWLGGEAIVYEGGQPRLGADGQQETIMPVVTRDKVIVHDNWDTLGLRGTASNDISMEGVFVPERHVARFSNEPSHDWAAFRCLPLAFLGHGTHALGVAKAAIEHATEMIQTKRGWANVPLRDFTRVQGALAEAAVVVEAASTHLYRTAQDLWDLTLAGGVDAVLRANMRLANSYAAQSSLRAVDLLHNLLATSAIFRSNPLERCFRDMHTASAHVMIGPLTYEAGGRVLLGKDVDFPFF